MNDIGPTSLERVLTALSHKEPDRVPFFLLVTIHGARELGLTIEEYFSDPRHMAEGQLRMRRRYGHDCLYGFAYASVESEAFGGTTLFFEDGPPNAGAPIARSVDEILALEPPEIADCPQLTRVLEAQALMKEGIGDEAPIIGVAMSPFSLPVMQLGFERYLEVMMEEPAAFDHLMKVNEAFCIAWANAQLDAGCAAICYFDPVSSTTNVTPEQYRKTGQQVAKRTLAAINGPVATHFASGRCLPIIDDVAETGTAVIGTSVIEDLGELKEACAGRLTVLGNLNGVEMRRWNPGFAEKRVKEAIAKAGPGGGFILSDNHGEIPWQVPEAVLEAIGDAVRKWGRYPLDWVETRG